MTLTTDAPVWWTACLGGCWSCRQVFALDPFNPELLPAPCPFCQVAAADAEIF
jgi:hypothetical protein